MAKIDASEQIKRFQDFIESSYPNKISENLRKDKKFIEVDFSELSKFDIDLANELLENPEDTIKAAEIAVEQLDIEDIKGIQILFYNLPGITELPLSEISNQLDKFLTFEGHIMKPSDIFLKCKSAKFECPSCGNIINVLMLGKEWKEPTKCGCGRKGKFALLDRELIKFQRIEIQEALDYVPDKPRRLVKKKVFLPENLTRKDIYEQLQPGQKVKIYGILEVEEIKVRGMQGKSNEYRTNIIANNIVPIESSWESIKLNSSQIKKIKKMAEKKNLLDEFIQSLAPTFEGYEMVRKSLILQHVEGKRIYDENGNLEERGIILVLMSGAPGCQPAGSKVLMANGEWKNIENIKPNEKVKSPYVDGNGVVQMADAEILSTSEWGCNEIYDIIDSETQTVLYSCSYNHPIPCLDKIPNVSEKYPEYMGYYNIPAREIAKTGQIVDTISKEGIVEIIVKLSKKQNTVYGFSLDSKSQWYVTDNFMITHNTGKSYLMKKSLAISPLRNWTTGKGLTKVGLVACIVRDEYGSFTLEVGPLIMSDKGILGIDEMEKMDKEDYGMLNNAMAEEKTKITKANIDQELRARTTIIATSNPIHKKFVDEEPIMNQLAPIPRDILDRFDALWPMRENIDQEKIGTKYMDRHLQTEGVKQIWSNEEMMDYISYSRKIDPILKPPIAKYFNEKFKKLTGQTVEETEQSHRLRGNIMRWAYSHTKFHGIGKEDKNKKIDVPKEAINFAFQLIRESFDKLGLISEEGFVKYEDVEDIPKKKEISKYYLVKNTLKELANDKQFRNVVPFHIIKDKINKEQEMDEDDIYTELEKLKKLGEIFEPHRDHFSLI